VQEHPCARPEVSVWLQEDQPVHRCVARHPVIMNDQRTVVLTRLTNQVSALQTEQADSHQTSLVLVETAGAVDRVRTVRLP